MSDELQLGIAETLQVFTCGPRKDHECDDKGESVFGLRDGNFTTDEARAKREGFSTWSVTCSVCKMSSMDRAMWQGF